METEGLRNVEQLALKKHKIYKQSLIRYLSRSMLASMFIGFGVIVAFKTGNFFYMEQSPFTYPMAALTFGAAIILIAYGGVTCLPEIRFITRMLHSGRKLRWLEVVKLWIASYSGNLMGGRLRSINLSDGIIRFISGQWISAKCGGAQDGGTGNAALFRGFYVTGSCAWRSSCRCS